jgi:DNA-binding GntR family transcriptional regulator
LRLETLAVPERSPIRPLERAEPLRVGVQEHLKADITDNGLVATWRDHADIVDAIESPDVMAARQRLDAHCRGIRQLVARSRTETVAPDPAWRPARLRP